MKLLVVLIVLGTLFFISSSTIVEYKSFELKSGGWIVERQNMWSNEDINGNQSVASFNFSETQLSEYPLHVAIFPFENISLFGVVYNNARHYCCSKELQTAKLCDVEGAFLNSSTKGYFRLEKDAPTLGEYNITITSTHSLVVASCNSSVTLTGSITWFNPYGYLPGSARNYLKIQLFTTMSIFYIILLLGFAILMFIHRHYLLKLQYGILLLMVSGVCEAAAAYFYYRNINVYGTASSATAALVFYVAFSIAKKTFSRFLLLVISMGFGVVKYTLGETKKKVLLLTGLYFFWSLILEVVDTTQSLSRSKPSNMFLLLLIIVPVSLLDTAFLYWIFMSLVRTMQQLTLRRQTVKLKLYKKCIIGLVVGAAASTVMVFYQLITALVRYQEYSWRSQWIGFAFWHLLHFFLLVYFAFLWRPTKNNTRYGYAEMYSEDNGDENSDAVQLETVTVDRDEHTDKDFMSNFDSASPFGLEGNEEEFENQLKKMD